MFEAIRTLRKQLYLKRLEKKGLNLGRNVFLNDGFFLDPSHCFLINIEDDVVFGPGVKIFAHDASPYMLIDRTKIGLVHLKRRCFIGANAVILPASSVGENSILGAGSVLSGDVPDNEVWGGNPAKFITTVADYTQKLLALEAVEYDEDSHRISILSAEDKQAIIDGLKSKGIGFMRKSKPSL